MENLFNKVSIYATILLAGFVNLLGGYDVWLKLILIFMALDFASGILKAFYTKQLTSQLGARGIIKKSYMLLIIAGVNMFMTGTGLDVAFSIPEIGITISPRELVIVFFASNEFLSILENSAQCGLPLPTWLTDSLLQLRQTSSGSSAESDC